MSGSRPSIFVSADAGVKAVLRVLARLPSERHMLAQLDT
jgi:hypothetical protein